MDVDRADIGAVILDIEEAIVADRACGIVRETEPGAARSSGAPAPSTG
ncbi:Hypothetical protein A7982_03971 [Minicystis rosea]|nr:Hypothetical protein A7982_03971 [Minicystis rosea]